MTEEKLNKRLKFIKSVSLPNNKKSHSNKTNNKNHKIPKYIRVLKATLHYNKADKTCQKFIHQQREIPAAELHRLDTLHACVSH